MHDFFASSDKSLKDVSVPDRKMLAEFLRVSSRPESTPRAVEAHVLTSLALALRSRQPIV